MALILWVILTLPAVYGKDEECATCPPKITIRGIKQMRGEEKDYWDGQISEQELLTASYRHPTILRSSVFKCRSKSSTRGSASFSEAHSTGKGHGAYPLGLQWK